MTVPVEPSGPDLSQYTVLGSIRVDAVSPGFACAGDQEGQLLGFEFETGDRIGVYAVLEGVFVASNLCYEYSAERDAWTCVSPSDGKFYAEAAYYAYYPYSENNSWDVVLPEDGTVPDGTGFFSALTAGWKPASDQSSREAFRQSCLMTGYAETLSGNTAEFLMSPLTSVAAIELPMEYYSFTNEDTNVPDYVINSPSDVVFSGDVRPCAVEDGKYLCSFLPKDAPSTEVAAADVIGIVYQIDPSRLDPALSEVLGDVHATVVSRKEPVRPAGQEGRYTNLFPWFTSSGTSLSSRDETLIGFKNIEGYSLEATFNMADADFCGYLYNALIREKRSEDLASGMYPAFQAALDFGTIAGGPLDCAPANSGWYLPSNGEWFDILRNLCGAELSLNENFVGSMTSMVSWGGQGLVASALNESMSKVSDEDKDPIEVGQAWWTSSTAGLGSSRTISFNDEGYIHSHWQYKDLGFKVRMVLAF